LEEDKIKTMSIDIISDEILQDCSAVIRGFEHLRNHAIFDKFKHIKNYVIWSDCGTQFRCKEMNYYYFTKLANDGICVNMNYFGEKHGKFTRDQHFSVISYYLKKESMKNKISSTQDIVDVINKCQAESNSHNTVRRKNENEVYALLLNPPTRNEQKTYVKHFRQIKLVQYFYNLQNKLIDGEFYLNSTLFSDRTDLVDPVYLNSVLDDSRVPNKFTGSSLLFDNTERLEKPLILKKKRKYAEQLMKPVSNNDDITDLLTEEDGLDQNNDPIINGINTLNEENDNLPITSRHDNGIDKSKNECTKKCENCNQKKRYTEEEIQTISHSRINEELKLHYHPKDRKILYEGKLKSRRINEARLDLSEHYKNRHALD
jgi:hypothetical protein